MPPRCARSLAGVTALERDLAETCQRARPDVARCTFERLFVELRREIELVEPQRELGLDEPSGLLVALVPGREEILGHSEPLAHLSEELQGGDSIPSFDARDVRR